MRGEGGGRKKTRGKEGGKGEQGEPALRDFRIPDVPCARGADERAKKKKKKKKNRGGEGGGRKQFWDMQLVQ